MVKKIRDVLVLWVAVTLMVVLGYQSIGHADDLPVKLSANPCTVVVYSQNYLSEVVPYDRKRTELLGMPTLECSRAKNTTHNVVSYHAQIEKYNTRYSKWMTYEGHRKVFIPWAKGQKFGVGAATAIRCDGPALYRVRVKYWTADTSGNSYASFVSARVTPAKRLCENTGGRRLSEVNNPQIVRL